eukprot:scaffold104089_cov64-Phaeocystis_antarctica.AAC.2
MTTPTVRRATPPTPTPTALRTMAASTSERARRPYYPSALLHCRGAICCVLWAGGGGRDA